ncbi:MAG: hypothetical protein U0521_27910 [Anaerolineae bacterium]
MPGTSSSWRNDLDGLVSGWIDTRGHAATPELPTRKPTACGCSTQTGEARQLLTLAQIDDALHTVMADLEMTSIGPVVWSPDGSRLLLWAGKTDGTPIQVWHSLSMPLRGRSRRRRSQHRASATARSLRPLQAAWSPDGNSLMVFTFGLHPDEDTTSLDPSESSVRGAVRVST